MGLNANVNKLSEAIDDFAKALQITPNDINTLFYRSLTYCTSGKKDLAKLDENKVAELGGKLKNVVNKYQSFYWFPRRINWP